MKLNFKEVIDKSGLTQTKIAQDTGMSYPTINNLYNGSAKSIYFDKLEELCKLLNCTPNDVLIMESDNKVSTPKQKITYSVESKDSKFADAINNIAINELDYTVHYKKYYELIQKLISKEVDEKLSQLHFEIKSNESDKKDDR